MSGPLLSVSTLLIHHAATEEAQERWRVFRAAYGSRVVDETNERTRIACHDGAEAERLLARLVAAGIPRGALRIVDAPQPTATERLRALGGGR